MATPRKGGIFRDFSTALINSISGTRAQTPASDASTSLAAQAAFTPAQQFFPSGLPMTPIAPPGSTTGRAFDYAAYRNLNIQPRSEPGEGSIGFATLRRMASPADGGLDLLRLAIETRKDQMVAQRWTIRGRDTDNDGGKAARDIEQWMRKPDGVHTYRVWLRMLLEDHFVIDAPTIYYSMFGGRPLLEIMDGATIKQLITAEDGRVPMPPLPAYQQILKGMPAENYTIQQLGYYAYNLLPYRLYGMSRVEQVIATVSMAINRGLSQLDYFTQGTTPDGFIEVPKEWNVEQIQQYAEWFNSILTGQLGERRRLQFVPNGANYKPTKDPTLKDQFDEWMARIICFCFSLPPQALVKETNRSTAETNKEAGQEEGLEPTKLWVKDTFDDALDRMGHPELELQWQDEEIVDPQVKATVISTYRGMNGGRPLITLAEGRKLGGFAPATPEQIAELAAESAPPPNLMGDGGDDPEDLETPPKKKPGEKDDTSDTGKDATKAATSRGGRSLPQLPRNTKHSARVQARLQRLANAVLTQQRKRVLAALDERAEKYTKTSADEIAALIREILADTWDDDAREKLWTLLSSLSEERAEAALEQLQPYLGSDAYAGALTQGNERAVEWARHRASNLITETNDTTRQLVNELTSTAIESGLTNRELGSLVEESFGFSDARGEMIARTETAFAEIAGTLEGYAASGIVEGKEWSADADACDECAALDGVVVSLDEDFPDEGGDGPPLHPNCLCGVVPVLSADAAALIEEE